MFYLKIIHKIVNEHKPDDYVSSGASTFKEELKPLTAREKVVEGEGEVGL